jgi:hypothetical protein
MQPDGGNDSTAFSFGNDHICVTFWRGTDDRVEGMMLSTRDCFSAPLSAPQDVMLGHLISLLGNPDGVALGDSRVSPDYYFFLGGRLYFQAWNDNHLCSLSPYISYELLTLEVADSRTPSVPEWKGFARRTKYGQSPDEQTFIQPMVRC